MRRTNRTALIIVAGEPEDACIAHLSSLYYRRGMQLSASIRMLRDSRPKHVMHKESVVSRYGELIFFCGKMGAGKSTLSAKIAHERSAVLISEDEWLAALFPGQIKDFNDYINYSSRLKPVLKSHVEQMLVVGTTVVLDFPGNTRKQRAWFKDIYAQRGIPHKLYYVDVEDEVCLKQLKQRQKEQPQRAQFDTEDVFRMVTEYFEPPEESEAFNVEIVERGVA